MSEQTDRLEEIRQEMLALLDEADGLVRRYGKGRVYDRAKSYWLAQMEMALSNDHSYLGGAGVSFEDTINEMGGEDEDENSDESS